MNEPTRQLLRHQVPNLRDTGGLRTRDGRLLSHRRLLRSAELGWLPPAGAHALTDYTGPGATYLDLRTEGEVAAGGEPTALVAEGWRWQRHPLRDRTPEDEETAPEAQLRRYLEHLPRYRLAARAVLRALSSGPVLVGCRLGKDRTGLVVALVQHWLGVQRGDIIHDFELSNRCLAEARRLLPPPWREDGRPPATVAGWVCEAVLNTGQADLQGLEAAQVEAARARLLDTPGQFRTGS